MLAEGLRVPSLGLWWAFARDTGKALAADAAREPAPGFFASVQSKSPLARAIDGEDGLIRFRNGYAHGATPDDETCSADLARMKPRVLALVEAAAHLASVTFVTVRKDGTQLALRGAWPSPFGPIEGLRPRRTYLIREGAPALDLHPLLHWRESPRGEGAFFYNDLKKNDAGALHYAWSQHARDPEIKSALLERYPLDAWKTSTLEVDDERAVLERIAALTESFKGRQRDLGELVDELGRRTRGIVMVWGAPGVGKSALLARTLQYLEWSEEAQRAAYPTISPPRAPVDEADELAADEEQDTEGRVQETLRLHVVRTFVRRGAYQDVRAIFEDIGRQIDRRFGLSVRGASNAPEAAALLSDRIAEAARRLGEHERLIVVIDGLDEAAEHGEFLRGLPKEGPDRVHLVYASREQPVVRSEVYDHLDMRLRRERTLPGLGPDDTRALLYEHVDKYAMQGTWVDTIVERSGGNALFLRLLCDALDRGEVAFNDVSAVPASMNALYDGILVRVAATRGASSLLALLATARAYLSEPLLAELLALEMPGFTLDEARAAVAACAEVLMDDPATPQKDWQLFHESLREYFVARRRAEVDAWHERLAEWARDWRRFEARPDARSYAIRWGATHLDMRLTWARANQVPSVAEDCEKAILGLVDDPAWRSTSMRVCGNAESMRRGIHFAQAIAIGHHRVRETPETRARVARYAEMMWGEEGRIYEAQRQALRTAHRPPGQWRDVHELARMGTTPKARGLLAIVSLWGDQQGDRKTVPQFSEAAREEMRGWFEEADDTALNRLWKILNGPEL